MKTSYSRRGSSHLGERGKRIKKSAITGAQLNELKLINRLSEINALMNEIVKETNQTYLEVYAMVVSYSKILNKDKK